MEYKENTSMYPYLLTIFWCTNLGNCQISVETADNGRYAHPTQY